MIFIKLYFISILLSGLTMLALILYNMSSGITSGITDTLIYYAAFYTFGNFLLIALLAGVVKVWSI